MPARDISEVRPAAAPVVESAPRLRSLGGQTAAILALQRTAGNALVSRALLQRQAAGDAPSPDQVAAAMTWAQAQRLGEEAIKELQGALGVAAGGAYDEATVAAVYAKQREWHPHGRIDGPGKATPAMFARLGLISTHTITAAGVGDQELAEIRTRFPHGVTVALYADYGAAHSGAEFLLQAGIFARNQGAVGLTGGSVALRVPVPIHDVSEVIEIVQSIHRGLLAKERAAAAGAPPAAAGGAPATAPAPHAAPPPGAQAVPEAAAGGGGGGGPANDDSAVPPHTRIKNLALFAHGESWGMGLESHNRFQLHAARSGLNPPNIAAFARGIRDAVTPDVGVQLFACLTGHDAGRTDYQEWTGHAQGEHTGEGSFAATLAHELGPDASVYGHTTAAHTTENFAARVYGAAAGGPGGLHMFDVLYTETFIQSELARLFADKTEEERAALHDPLREQMWAHYKDSITGEHHRRSKRYPVPIGQEMSVNPEHARALVQADFPTWVEPRRARIRPPRRQPAVARMIQRAARDDEPGRRDPRRAIIRALVEDHGFARENIKEAGPGGAGADYLAWDDDRLWIIEDKNRTDWESAANAAMTDNTPLKQLMVRLMGARKRKLSKVQAAGEQTVADYIASPPPEADPGRAKVVLVAMRITEADALLALELPVDGGMTGSQPTVYPVTVESVLEFLDAVARENRPELNIFHDVRRLQSAWEERGAADARTWLMQEDHLATLERLYTDCRRAAEHQAPHFDAKDDTLKRLTDEFELRLIPVMRRLPKAGGGQAP